MTAAPKTEADTPAPRTACRVLLVEDDPVLARAVTRALRNHCVEVTHTVDGAALARVEGPFDVGIFDIDLPDANGVQLAERCLERRLVGEVVFFSGTQSAQHITSARMLGELIEKGEGVHRLLDHVLPACSRLSGVYAKSAIG